jgi:heat shock protein HslJ
MTSMLARLIWVTIAIMAVPAGAALAQIRSAAWLDEPKPASWNQPGQSIPAAPKVEGEGVDRRCKDLARPPTLDEDKAVRDRGWNLVGDYQGGRDTRVIRGTASYDGMCRPRQYQDFVFVRGVFAGTLAPEPMDSRTDGALARVSTQTSGQLIAEYARYSTTDPLCCPSRTTRVVFDVANEPPLARPVSISTTDARSASPAASPSLVGTSWQLVKFQGGDDTTLTPDDRTKYTIAFGAAGRLTARIDCNRGRGTWKSSGANQIHLGPLALTRAKCPAGSMHDQLVKQWDNIRSYVIRNGHLFLALMADGGIYEFEPVTSKR